MYEGVSTTAEVQIIMGSISISRPQCVQISSHEVDGQIGTFLS